jgi:hypothetical protein
MFNILDRLQNIPPFYPIRDMSSPSYQVKLLESVIRRGLCRGILDVLRQKPLPVVSSHPATAIAIDAAGVLRNYCIVCDAEISRAWVAADPKTSRIHYFAPCGNAVSRLKSYGVPEERIFLTGFPLPTELLGDENLSVLKYDVGQRLHHLDPTKRFWPLHGKSAEHFLGRRNCRFREDRTLTLTYAVGGAGAQREIGYQALRSLRQHILDGRIRLNLVAGIRSEVRDYFEEARRELVPDSAAVRIIFEKSKFEYFRTFSAVMRETDVLWTKPSELSFYAGLGIPIILAPTIGSQEEYNRKWLLEIQAGILQEDPDYTDEWFFDLLNRGRFAESAWDGFLKARKYGTYKIQEILDTGTMAREDSPLKR